MMKTIVMLSWQRKFRCEGEKCRLEAGSGGQGEGQGGQGGGLAKPLIFNQPRYQVMTTFLSSGEIENHPSFAVDLQPAPQSGTVQFQSVHPRRACGVRLQRRRG